MRHPALRLSVIRVQVERLRVRTVLARNLGEVLFPSRNLNDGIDLPRAFLLIGVLRGAARKVEVEVVLCCRGRQEQRNQRQPENAHLGQSVGVRVEA
jgi:hypothetical protein